LRETIKPEREKTMPIKTALNRIERFKSFVFGAVSFQVVNGSADVELFFLDIKTSMGMDILRCQTPEMIRKEILDALHYLQLRAAADVRGRRRGGH
jgi:hypothetical protein